MPVYALGDATPEIHPDAFVHPEATVIGNVWVGAESTIWPQTVLRGDYGEIHIGARTSIQDGTVVHCTQRHPTIVGDDCVVGHLAHLECCIIEDESLVGTNSVVLHRAIVRTGARVGPAKLRPDSVAPGMIAALAAGYVENGRRYLAELRRID